MLLKKNYYKSEENRRRDESKNILALISIYRYMIDLWVYDEATVCAGGQEHGG
jgi:hypothetical protein